MKTRKADTSRKTWERYRKENLGGLGHNSIALNYEDWKDKQMNDYCRSLDNLQHTPGPWTVQPDGSDTYLVLGPAKCYIASVDDALTDQNKSNARLIAAAPDLLEAVKNMFLYISTYGGEVTSNFTCGGNGEAYKALIARAEGK